jgi:hypothetical protein
MTRGHDEVRTGKAKLVVQKESVRFTCPRRNRADTAAKQRPPARNFDSLAAIIQCGKRGIWRGRSGLFVVAAWR